MKDYKRDPKTGVLFFCNEEKEHDILRQREQNREMNALRDELNSLKSMITELLAARN